MSEREAHSRALDGAAEVIAELRLRLDEAETQRDVLLHVIVEIRDSTILWRREEASEKLKSVHGWAVAALDQINGDRVNHEKNSLFLIEKKP